MLFRSNGPQRSELAGYEKIPPVWEFLEPILLEREEGYEFTTTTNKIEEPFLYRVQEYQY